MAVTSMRKFGFTPIGVRLISTSKRNEAFYKGDKERVKKDAKTILEEERNGIFRVFDVGKGGRIQQGDKKRLPRINRDKMSPPRHTQMKPDQDWNSVWPAARSFHPAVVPLPVRQGVRKMKNQVMPSKYANAELMKIPNFLHLTPPVIKKHCSALRKFCTPFPAALDSDEKIEKHFPVKVLTSNYLNSDSSIRDRRSRVVVYTFGLSSLQLDQHARDKIIRLLGDRYDVESDIVTLTVDRCPYRGQNLDYANYLVTALYFESWRVDAWEVKDHMDHEEFIASKDIDADDDYKNILQDILNKGEDEETLRKYKEATRKLLNLPEQDVQAEIFN